MKSPKYGYLKSAIALGALLFALATPASAFTLLGSKWNPGPNSASFGPMPAPGSATFSIMGAGLSDASGFHAVGHDPTTVAITSLGVAGWGMADYIAVVDWALDQWAAVSGFTNLGLVADSGAHAGALESAGGHVGDIRVAAWEITTAGVLAHAFQPGTEAIFGAGGTIAGDVHFDVARVWVDDAADAAGDPDFDIYTVMLHEIGHALGVGHSAVVGSVMEPVYAGSRRTLHADDIAAIQAIYGPNTSGVPEAGSTMILMGLALSVMVVWTRKRR